MPEEYGTTDTQATTLDSGSAVSSTEPGQSGAGGNEGTPSSTTASASSSSGQVTGQAPASQPSQPSTSPAAGGWTSIRDAAYQLYGVDMRDLPNDNAALQRLIAEAGQARQHQQYAQRYMQHAGQFEQWLQSQQQQTQQAKPQNALWNPPEYNPAWKGLVSRDAQTGEYKLAQGAPPDVLPKYLQYEQYRRDFVEKLTSDPVNTLKPFVEDVARQIAESQIKQNLGSYQDQVYADSYVSQNSGWLHQRDQQGNVLTDPFSKQPLLSPAGQRFKTYVEQAHQGGIQDLRTQERWARSMVERDIAIAQLQQLQAGAQNQQTKNQFLAANNQRNPNQSGVLAPGGTSPVPSNQRLSLADRLTQRLHAEGITDADFRGETR